MIIAIIFIAYILKSKPAANYKILIILASGCIIWLLGNVLDIISTDFGFKVFWNHAASLGVVIVTISFLFFALEYTGIQSWLKPSRVLYVCIVPAVWLIFDFTNQYHGLSLSYGMEKIGGYYYLTKQYGIVFWIYTAYAYILILHSYYYLVKMLLSASSYFKKKAGFIIMISAVPIIFNILYLTDIGPFKYFDPTPVSLTVSILFFLFGITNYRLGEIVPATRDALIENIRDGVIVLDRNNRIVEINPIAKKMIKSTKVLGKDIESFWPKYSDYLIGHSAVDRELPVGTGDNKKIYDVQISPYSDYRGDLISSIISLRDITERKKTEEKLRYLSFHDKMTGLYNRAFFEEEMKRLDVGRELPISIVMGDADGLKLINDTFGYEKGDALLVTIGKIIEDTCREEDIIARWGGDEYAILFPKTGEETALKIVERIENNCTKTISPDSMPISISLGVATKTDVSQDIKEIIRQAEDRMRRRKMLKTESVHSLMILSLRKTLQEKSFETEEHIDRLKMIAQKLGKRAGLSMSQVDELSLVAVLHDIGKVTIADSILLKTGKLTKQEWKTMKRHPEIGYKIASSSPQLAPIAECILYHHEWWDGNGYPRGLKGKDIPLLSRIITIVDAYDVMINGRPYKKPMNHEEVMEELKRCAGIQFDPELVKNFTQIVEKDFTRTL
jgi:diguanylate cyclase (GGDEF)-like protein/PAS domain S-box-containing protein